jgi:hypothetical protein
VNEILLPLLAAAAGWAVRHFRLGMGPAATPAAPTPASPLPALPISHDQFLGLLWGKLRAHLLEVFQEAIKSALADAAKVPAKPAGT